MSEKINNKLRSCPFCNFEKPVLTDEICEDGLFAVWCKDGCSASIGFYDTAKEAYEAWNTRAGVQNSELKKLIEDYENEVHPHYPSVPQMLIRRLKALMKGETNE